MEWWGREPEAGMKRRVDFCSGFILGEAQACLNASLTQQPACVTI